MPREYQFRESEASQKEIYCIYGMKGTGKTHTALGFEGKKYVLSLDRKSQRIATIFKEKFQKSDIVVLDAVEYLTHIKTDYLSSAVETYNFICYLLNQIKERGDADWIVIDGLELIIEISEMKMRSDSSLTPFQAFSNLSLWKDRKMNIRGIHDLAYRAANKGVIYTTYSEKDELIEDGSTVRKRDVPRWIDIIMYEVDVLMQTEIKFANNQARFLVNVKTSKLPSKFRTGGILDLTDSTVEKALVKEREAVNLLEGVGETRPKTTVAGKSL